MCADRLRHRAGTVNISLNGHTCHTIGNHELTATWQSGSQLACSLARLALSALHSAPDGPGPAAEQFFAALAIGDTAAAAAAHRQPRRCPRRAQRGLGRDCRPPTWTRRSSSSKYAEDTGSVDYRYTWHLPKNRTWSYDGQLKMVRDEGRWQVRWSATGLHPKLGEHQTFALRADPPRRASVNELGGTDVLAPGYLYHYTLDASQAGRAADRRRRMRWSTRCGPFDDTLNDPQRLAEQASSSTQPLDLVTLRPDDNDKRRPGDRQTARRRGHSAGRHAADRRPLRARRHRRGEEGGDRPARRRGRLAGGQRQPERRRRRRAERGRGRRRRRRSRSRLDRAVQNAAQHAVDTRAARR